MSESEGEDRNEASGSSVVNTVQPNVNTPIATYRVNPPEQFNFTKPESWPKWSRRFERFRQSSALAKEPDELQINSLIYHMGDEAEDILSSLKLTAEQCQSYQTVIEKFDGHFVISRNVIYERAVFNRRGQEEGESIDSFINSLHILARHCEYGVLHDDFIRDRIVVGIRDCTLSARMQGDSKLTLASAVQMARQKEMIAQQQSQLRKPETSASVDAVKFRKPPRQNSNKKYSGKSAKKEHSNSSKAKRAFCQRCGSKPAHKWAECPAREATCYKCKKKGHFSSACLNSKKIDECVLEDDSEVAEEFFLYELGDDSESESGPWVTNVHVNNTVLRFKIDCGADVTAIPEESFDKLKGCTLRETNKRLLGPARIRLEVLGVFTPEIRKGNKIVKQNIYVVKNLDKCLLGRPAIQAMNLLKFVDSVSVDEVEDEFPMLFKGLGEIPGEYDIELKDNAVPYSLNTPRRVPIPLLDKVKQELQRMQDEGVIEPVTEPTDWCSGIVVVPKGNDHVRICVDLTQLNNNVKREIYTMPSVEHVLGQVRGAKYFSRLDANSGFYQLKLSEKSSKLTTFVTPFGRFCFRRLPFGISSAPEVFQRKMSQILEGLPGVICLMDDILIYGLTQEEHDDRLVKVLRRLADSKVTLNSEKCEFSKTKLKFVGHVISASGVEPDPEKVAAIRDMKAPTDKTELRRFLGMVNQMSKFSDQLAENTKPLRELLQKDRAFYWDDTQQSAFEEIKLGICRAPTLALYDPGKDTMVSSDASSYGIGAELKQKQEDGTWRPVMFASRSLTETEQRYAQIEKEALAITWGTERFNNFLLGKHFQVETDHKPLIPILGSKSLNDLSPRLQRFRMRLMRYSYTVFHTPGKNLAVADTLSRSPVDSGPILDVMNFERETQLHVDSVVSQLPTSDCKLSEIASEQKKVYGKIFSYVQDGWPSYHALHSEEKYLHKVRHELSIANGLLLKGSRLVIPPVLRAEILSKIHAGHQGVRKCRERASSAVWWPGLSDEIKSTVEKCRVCSRYRTNPTEPLLPTPLPERPWQRVGTDLFELNKSMYLLVIDYYSRYIELVKLSSTASSNIIKALKGIFSRHGIPETMLSDNGPQYSSAEFRDFAQAYNFEHTTSSPLYPKSNGEAERAVRTCKNLLLKTDDPHLAMLEYRATPVSCGLSPAELLMGRKLRASLPKHPSQLEPKPLRDREFKTYESQRKANMKADHDRRHCARNLPELKPGDPVWVNKCESKVVTKAGTPRSYIVSTPSGEVRRNRSDLKVIPSTPVKTMISSPEIASPASVVNNNIQFTAHNPPTPNCVKTKSGRVTKPPKRLDL